MKNKEMKNLFLLPTPNPSRLSINTCFDNILELCDEIDVPKIKQDGCIQDYNIYITNDEEIIGGKEWFLDLTDNSLFKNKVDVPMSKVLFPNCKKIILTTDPDLIKDGVQSIPDEFLEWFVKNPSCSIRWIEYVEVKKQERFRFEHRCDDGINIGYSDNITPYHSYKETSIKNWDRLEKEFMYKIIIPKEELNPFELPNTLPDDVFYESLESKQETEHLLSTETNKKRLLEDVNKQETLEEFINKTNTPEGLDQFTFDEGIRVGAKWQQERSYSEEEVLEILDKYLYFLDEESTKTAEEWFEQFKK